MYCFLRALKPIKAPAPWHGQGWHPLCQATQGPIQSALNYASLSPYDTEWFLWASVSLPVKWEKQISWLVPPFFIYMKVMLQLSIMHVSVAFTFSTELLFISCTTVCSLFLFVWFFFGKSQTLVCATLIVKSMQKNKIIFFYNKVKLFFLSILHLFRWR